MVVDGGFAHVLPEATVETATVSIETVSVFAASLRGVEMATKGADSPDWGALSWLVYLGSDWVLGWLGVPLTAVGLPLWGLAPVPTRAASSSGSSLYVSSYEATETASRLDECTSVDSRLTLMMESP